MTSVLVPGFSVRQHGFPFPNSFPDGTPVVSVPTPFGKVNFGNAGVGVCGGMVYAAVDLFLYQIPVPPEPTEPVFRYFCRRLLDSFGFPFGWTKYWNWQVRSHLAARTERDWPRIKAVLDDGQLCPLGLVKVHSWDPRQLGHNHQVLAYGYDWTGDDNLTLFAYDPNYPGNTVELRAKLDGSSRPVHHSFEGESVRGFFPTAYHRPADPPVFARPSS